MDDGAPRAERETGDDRRSGLIVGEHACRDAAERVAAEIARLLGQATVRDRATGVRAGRRGRPTSRFCSDRATAHREFEKALERRGVSTYVYKGLGFFDADEVQDVVALLRYLADPLSDLRAATLLRSRLVRLSDRGDRARWRRAWRRRSSAPEPPAVVAQLSTTRIGACSTRLRAAVPRWLSLGRSHHAVGAAERESCRRRPTPTKCAGARHAQARENLKKLGAMVRRFQNRGYATLARVADHLEQLAVGDESNAAIDAQDAVSLMTVHAAKGLEFPIVFVVNMGRGTGNIARADPGGGRRRGRTVGGDRRLSVGSGRGRAGARSRRDQAAAVRRADARARPAVSVRIGRQTACSADAAAASARCSRRRSNSCS